MKISKLFILGTTLASVHATDMPIIDTSNAYYGDFSSSDVHVINIDTMKRNQILQGGFGAYGLEAIGNKYLISLSRKDTSVDIIKVDQQLKRIVNVVELGYQPREVATSPDHKYSVVSGRDIPAHTVFNAETGDVIKHYNREQEPVTITDFGGQNATGHPFFINDTEYLILDRVHKEIRLYDVINGLEDTLKTETSTHHILRKNDFLYVSMEGSGSSNESIVPAILKLEIKDHKISLIATAYLKNDPITASCMQGPGIHHMNFHYDGTHIYTGSNNGLVYVINTDKMIVVDHFRSGNGGGHVDFSPKNKIGVITNHKSTYITFVDVSNPKNNRIIGDTVVANYEEGVSLQGHTQIITDDEEYFVGAATNDSNLFKVDLHTREIVEKLNIEGAILEQGFMYQSEEGKFAKVPQKYSKNSISIRNTMKNKFLTTFFGNATLAFDLIFAPSSRLSKISWDIVVRHDGYVNIVDTKTKKCLDEDNNFVVTRTCSNLKYSQLWKIENIDPNNVVHIKNYNTKCLTTYFALSTALDTCNGSPLAQWEFRNILAPNTLFDASKY